jgi:hypothetical protein
VVGFAALDGREGEAIIIKAINWQKQDKFHLENLPSEFDLLIIVNMCIKRSFAILLLAVMSAYGTFVQAQVQRSFLNTSFEQPVLAGGACFAQVYDNAVPFWTTTSPTGTPIGSCTQPVGGTASGLIEIWANSFNGVPARDGVQFAELNADQPSALYQNVCINNGETVSWALSHRGRAGPDTMVFVLGDTPA